MTGRSEFWDVVERIRAADRRYAQEAYAFLMDSLDHTVRAIGERRHVSADELLAGLCHYAQDRYGVMAFTVLKRWGLATSEDVGEVVFQLIDAGILSRQDEDAREDFDEALDLEQAIEGAYFDEDGSD